MDLLWKNLDIVAYAVAVVSVVLIAVLLRRNPAGAAPPVGDDAATEAAAKARLGTLTGVSFDDSAEDLQDARPKTAPPQMSAAAAASLSASGDPGEGQVLTQYTTGDGKGVEEMERMLAKDPDNLQLLDWLAFMYYSNNETEKAISTYSRIIAIDPGNAGQHYYLANSYYKAKRIDEALRHWRKVCEIKPDGKLARKASSRIQKVEAALG